MYIKKKKNLHPQLIIILKNTKKSLRRNKPRCGGPWSLSRRRPDPSSAFCLCFSSSSSRSREILDQQDGTIEDDGLTGLLRLATSILKHKPPFKFSREGQEFLRDVHNLLFLLPSLADRAQPKCKSHAARAAAYDLLVETVKGSVENYRLLHNWVMSQHMQGEGDGERHGALRLFLLSLVLGGDRLCLGGRTS